MKSSSKKSGKGKRPGKGGNRYWKSIGLGFKTPRDAIEGIICGTPFFFVMSNVLNSCNFLALDASFVLTTVKV